MNKDLAMKKALTWWRSEKEASRQHLRRVSGLKNSSAITRYWLQVVATPEELKEVGAL